MGTKKGQRRVPDAAMSTTEERHGMVLIDERKLLAMWRDHGQWMFTEQMSYGYKTALNSIHDLIPLSVGEIYNPDTYRYYKVEKKDKTIILKELE